MTTDPECPKCGEVGRQVERVDDEWFCQTCAFSWPWRLSRHDWAVLKALWIDPQRPIPTFPRGHTDHTG